ncbi:DUF2254 domain-containing protein [Tamlana crocina]|uniref:DUF2254 domain-containing protein n=1 Tax=Tamlana crocina TaxID=393006 RepID=A0ABX1DA47_9FLAO|nr:DUF2254 domain-containing protein [Tamlana crocina]NJX15257.1 DUF2254 domain-containing protein [Tamlana crocina]
MKTYFYKIFKYVIRLESKIAFYPTIISVLGVFFAFLMYYLEELNLSNYLKEHTPWLVIKNIETARVILTTFVAGLVSIMVFSFSMVMLLLNQASSSYSPRVLPGLISNRRHQIILGIFNSCLLYCIFTLIALDSTDSQQYQIPGFSVLLSIVFMAVCLGAFIYFIHSISQEIQINNIMKAIFLKAKSRLETIMKSENDIPENFPESKNWTVLKAVRSGYIEDVGLPAICEVLKDDGLKAEIVVYKGEYVLEGMPLLKVSNSVTDEQEDKLLAAFSYSRSELIEDNYVLAFKHITEIIVKAMSPGINDPGTALNGIDYLMDLFMLRMQKQDHSYYFNDNDEAVIYVKTLNFKLLLYNVMSSLRTYCTGDVIIVQKLIKMLGHLLQNHHCAHSNYKDDVREELENLLEDAKRAIKNPSDVEVVSSQFNAVL